MKFRSVVEPQERMKGLEVPAEVVEKLGGGKKPRVTITINGHSWQSMVTIMRGRHLIGLSIANRAAANLVVGETVEVDLRLNEEPPTVEVPADLAAALAAEPGARAAYDSLAYSHRRMAVYDINGAKKPETRARRIEKFVESLR